MKPVVCVGAVNIDVMLHSDRFCEPDEEVHVNNIEVCSGGQAGNIASALGKLGHKPYFLGHIGTDTYTQMLKKNFEETNVEHSFALTSETPNNTAYCIIDKKGDRQLYTYDNTKISSEQFPGQLYSAEMIVFTSLAQEKAIEEYARIAKKAKERGVSIALVPSSLFTKKGFETLKPLLKYTDYFIASEREINELLANREFNELKTLVPHIAITHGKRGASLYSAEKKITGRSKRS